MFCELRIDGVRGSSEAWLLFAWCSHGAFSPPLEAFDDDEPCDGGLAAYLFEWSVFRRVVPLVEALHALEFEDDQTLRIPVTLHYLYCATASKVLATIVGNGGWGFLPIFGIAIRIADPDVNNSVDCHRLCSFTPLPNFVANFTISARSVLLLFFMPLFTRRLRRGILRNSFAGSCIDRSPRSVRMASKALHASWRRTIIL